VVDNSRKLKIHTHTARDRNIYHIYIDNRLITYHEVVSLYQVLQGQVKLQGFQDHWRVKEMFTW